MLPLCCQRKMEKLLKFFSFHPKERKLIESNSPVTPGTFSPLPRACRLLIAVVTCLTPSFWITWRGFFFFFNFFFILERFDTIRVVLLSTEPLSEEITPCFPSWAKIACKYADRCSPRARIRPGAEGPDGVNLFCLSSRNGIDVPPFFWCDFSLSL